MSDTSTNATPEPGIDESLAEAIINILETTNSPAIQRAREVIAHRLAIAGDIAPSRIPAPRNITEIGGYINLLSEYGEAEQRARMIAAALGIAGPQISLPQPGAVPPLSFVTLDGARPAGPQQPSFPLTYTIRSDFVPAFDNAVQEITIRGGAVPILTPVRILPAAGSAPATDGSAQLALIGRTLSLAPTAALHAVATDPLSLSRPTAGGGFEVMVRVIDAAAPIAGTIAAENWTSWECDASACTEVDSNDARFALTPLLNAAGWHQPADPGNPTSLSNPGTWAEWRNITGLVPGVTRFADELQLQYSAEMLITSPVFNQLDNVWTGSEFAAP
ncbi:hypothetical protein [Ruegeria sp. HKCCA4812]|uniref:hypothetical protein n=1 Tax=Ruegeria sp. HKCCA4812 TaxID=2682993 RepID=UPI0014877E87|nr:hypothetical protein [Ruegeria sp. HKCCA4812]